MQRQRCVWRLNRTTLDRKKIRTSVTFSHNSNSPGSVSTDLDIFVNLYHCPCISTLHSGSCVGVLLQWAYSKVGVVHPQMPDWYICLIRHHFGQHTLLQSANSGQRIVIYASTLGAAGKPQLVLSS